jgi:hypothetical protein
LTACSSPDKTAVEPFDTTALPRIRLTEQAQIVSGTAANEPVLHQVSGAIVLSTGDVAVANINSEILVFGADGAFRRTVGRSGGGPGEFRFLLDVVRLDDDRILAWDPAQARVTVFLQDGGLNYACTPQGVDLARVGGGFVGAFGDGRFVLGGSSAVGAGPGAPEGPRSDTIPYLLFDRSGTFVRTIGQFAPKERHYSATSGYRRYLLDTSVHAVVADGLLLTGESDSIVLTRIDSSGAVRSRLSLDRSPRPVTEPDIEAAWRDWVEQRAVAREQMFAQAMMTMHEDALLAMRERIRADVEDELPEAKRTIEPAVFLPAYKSIMVGSDGALWLEDYLSPTLKTSRWILMDAGFSPVGWIELQPNERLLAAGPNTVVILRKDELDIESVVILAGDWPPVHAAHD